uniref:Arginine kinase n=1 Tax=Palpitomonas bilix TaxID=652834 RepID=A0A7S3DD70_9EUKA|mmetsp:Transcript_3192/g.6184  ORF Transcript_3192/g.6184 Transcript_3192/m.6184 type:complete len:472 (+) Transcript_3192:75-1490(+)
MGCGASKTDQPNGGEAPTSPPKKEESKPAPAAAPVEEKKEEAPAAAPVEEKKEEAAAAPAAEEAAPAAAAGESEEGDAFPWAGELNEFPELPEDCHSLLKKCLTKEVFEELKDKKTASGFTLKGCVNSGVQNPDSGVGVYGGDEESYSTFGALFDPLIEAYHGHTKDAQHTRDLDSDKIPDEPLDEKNEFIISTRVRVGRNIKDMPLAPLISKAQRKEVEKRVTESLSTFEGDLAGKYYSLESLSEEERKQLIDDHFLFKEGDRFLAAAGANRDWPSGRGIFHNDNKTFLVWVNEEDQLRIISMEKGGGIKSVFSRLCNAIKEMESKIEFAFNDHLGNISSCPTNLGTAMRASVHIKLPLLASHKEELDAIADKYKVQIRGIHGEHSSTDGGIFDISNRRRLGLSEVECVQSMYEGVQAMIARERELQAEQGGSGEEEKKEEEAAPAEEEKKEEEAAPAEEEKKEEEAASD